MVRRWIRNSKLKVEPFAKKDGNAISKKKLNKFLKPSPKYVVGKMTVTQFAMLKQQSDMEEKIVSKTKMHVYVRSDIMKWDN